MKACLQLAMLTGRVLLVDWTTPSNLSDLFENPPLKWTYNSLLLDPEVQQSFNESHLLFDFSNE